jgi:hypothetical protein
MSTKESQELNDLPKDGVLASNDHTTHSVPGGDEKSPKLLISDDIEFPVTTNGKIVANEATDVNQHGQFIELPPVEQRRLMRKIDWHLVPWVALLHWLSALDLSILGKARLFGLEHDLHMAGTDFNVVVLTFSISHILFELPSNLLLRRVRPSIWLPCIFLPLHHLIVALALGWGLVTMLTGWVQNMSDLVVCRLFTGLFEAGLFPGVIYLISTWYRRDESATPPFFATIDKPVQKRIMIFIGISTLAGAFSG